MSNNRENLMCNYASRCEKIKCFHKKMKHKSRESCKKMGCVHVKEDKKVECIVIKEIT